MEAGRHDQPFRPRAREAERLASFYVDVLQLEARNVASEEGGYFLTDGRTTMSIVPRKVSSLNGAGIEQPAVDHIGFRTPDLAAFKAGLDRLAKTDIALAPTPIHLDPEDAARLALLEKRPLGSLQVADPDATLIDVAEDA